MIPTRLSAILLSGYEWRAASSYFAPRLTDRFALMHEREHGESPAEPAVPERPLAVAQPAGILRLQSTIGNRATRG